MGKVVEQAALPLGQGMDRDNVGPGCADGRHTKPFQKAVLTAQGRWVEDEQRQDDHRGLPRGHWPPQRAGIPSGFEEHFSAMGQVAGREMGFKLAPVQGLSPDGVVPMNAPPVGWPAACLKAPIPDGYGWRRLNYSFLV